MPPLMPGDPLIAAGDAENEDHRLQENLFSPFKFSYMLLGSLVGFFLYSSILVVKLLVIPIWDADVVTKPKTDTFVISLLCSLIFSAIVFTILGFLRNLVVITYSAIGRRSKYLLEEIISDINYGFVVGSLVGISLAQTVSFLVALLVVAFCAKS
jgi:quinol-cytochrome oxidoreductase complex cytochrome b subunit